MEGDRQVGPDRVALAPARCRPRRRVGTSSATTGPGWRAQPGDGRRRPRRAGRPSRRCRAARPRRRRRSCGSSGRNGSIRDADGRGDRRHGRRRPGVRGGAPPGRQHPDPPARLQQVAGHHHAVAAVVARARPGSSAAPASGQRGEDRLGGGQAGPLHQEDRGHRVRRTSPAGRRRAWPRRRRAACTREPADADEGWATATAVAQSSQISPRDASATAKAIAESRPWVSETWTALDAEVRGPAAAYRPWRAMVGRAAPADHLDLAPAGHADAERLAHGLLRREAGGEVLGREGLAPSSRRPRPR